MMWRSLVIVGLGLAVARPGAARAQEQAGADAGINALAEVGLSQLSDPGNTALGQAALAVRPGEWKHAETPHFILHFFRNFVAAQAAVQVKDAAGLEAALSGSTTLEEVVRSIRSEA